MNPGILGGGQLSPTTAQMGGLATVQGGLCIEQPPSFRQHQPRSKPPARWPWLIAIVALLLAISSICIVCYPILWRMKDSQNKSAVRKADSKKTSFEDKQLAGEDSSSDKFTLKTNSVEDKAAADKAAADKAAADKAAADKAAADKAAAEKAIAEKKAAEEKAAIENAQMEREQILKGPLISTILRTKFSRHPLVDVTNAIVQRFYFGYQNPRS